jgi:DNA topoisomerase-3
MDMIGILCEKPSAGKNFAKALGGVTGTYNGENYVITCAHGHLYEFSPPEKQVGKALVDKYKSWSVENLPWNEADFKWVYDKKKDASDTLNKIKSTLSKCDEICIATDDDPTGEGELLAWEILDQLNLAPHHWSRMYFEDESVKEIQKAFKSRKSIKSMQTDADYIKAFYRARWDFLSMQWTRIATGYGDGRSVLREGRLKSVMVVLVGDQLKLVNAYKKVPYYQNRFKDENGIVYSNPEEPSFPKKEDVPNKYHSSAVVVDGKAMKSTAPPQMLDLAGLASRLSSKYPSKLVADVYQKMYQDQIVSYPRTEDKKISVEQFNDLLPLVDKIAAVVGVDASLLTHRTPRNTHIASGMAHGANRPGTTVPKSLADLAKYGTCAADIYKLLACNYLATLAEDYEYESQKGHLKDYPDFKGTASVPKKMGWKAVYSDDDIDDDATAGLGTMADPFVHEGFPPKPATPTMKWLMKQLEKYDVGTGATRVSTYAEVTNDKAKFPILKDTKGKITMTQFGEMSYRILPGTNIGSLEVTERLYGEMRDIAAGKMDPEAGLRDIQRMIKEDIITMSENGKVMRKELNIMATAGNDVERYEGTWNGKAVKFKRSWSGHNFTDEECEKLCNGEEIEIEAVSSKSGKTFRCTGKLANLTYNGRKYVGFDNTGFVNASGGKSGGGIPDEWCQHKFTDDEKALLETGMSVECDDFVSKKGSKFSAKVRYGKNDKGYMGIIPEFG